MLIGIALACGGVAGLMALARLYRLERIVTELEARVMELDGRLPGRTYKTW